MFDQRSPKSATLSILLPAASTLLLLSLEIESDSDDSDPESSSQARRRRRLVCTPIKQIAATDACTVSATRPSKIRDLVVLKNPSPPDHSSSTRGRFGLISSRGLELTLDENTSAGRDVIRRLESNGDRHVILKAGKKKSELLTTTVELDDDDDELGQTVLETLAQVLSQREFERILLAVLDDGRARGLFERIEAHLSSVFGIESSSSSGPRPGDDSDSNEEALNKADAFFLARLRRSRPSSSSTRRTRTDDSESTSSIEQPFESVYSAILVSLHLLVQSLRLRLSTLERARRLAKLVVDLAYAVGLPTWVDEYRRTWGPLVARFGPLPRPTRTFTSHSLYTRRKCLRVFLDSTLRLGLVPKHPPNVVVHLFNLLACTSLAPDTTTMFSLESVAQRFTSEPPSGFYGVDSSPLSFMTSLVDIFTLLAPSSSSSSSSSTATTRAHEAIFKFHTLGFTLETLRDVPFGLSMPIREAIRTCQLDPPDLSSSSSSSRSGKKTRSSSSWDGFFDLIGREELERKPSIANVSFYEREGDFHTLDRGRLNSPPPFAVSAAANERSRLATTGRH